MTPGYSSLALPGIIERVTDRCVVLNYGKKIAEGTYREVAEDPLVRQAYLGLS